METTLAIVKPNAVKAGYTGPIITSIEKAGFKIIEIMRVQLTVRDAQHLYAVHRERPFYQELITYITSGPVIVMALEKENAVADFRQLIGPTDPVQASPGTLRKLYGTDIGHNGVHGSDSMDSAQKEVAFFFRKNCCGGGCC